MIKIHLVTNMYIFRTGVYVYWPILLAQCAALSRSCDSHELIDLLNNAPLRILPAAITTKAQFHDFMDYLTPWLVGEPTGNLTVTTRPFPYAVDCTDKIYANVLTGRLRPAPVTVVDFCPFGYDMDMLEVRLLELWDAVDIFVIYESAYTQQGNVKPLYFLNSLATTDRFHRFQSKIVHLYSTANELAHIIMKPNFGWELERNIRTGMRDKFLTSMHPLVRRLLQDSAGLQTALAFQNDGDELVNGRVALHAKFCEPRGPPPYATPSACHKMNLEWFCKTHTNKHGAGWARAGLAAYELGDYEWYSGPSIIALNALVQQPNVDILNHFRHSHQDEKRLNFGPGAAIHMSSPSEYVLAWMKTGGTIEAKLNIPPRVLAAAQQRRVTAEVLAHGQIDAAFDPTLGHVCGIYYKHITEFDPATRILLLQSIPWPIQYNPARYCFLNPLRNTLRCRWQKDHCHFASYGPRYDYINISKHYCEVLLRPPAFTLPVESHVILP